MTRYWLDGVKIVETCLEPYALPRADSIWSTVTPRAEALSRSMSTTTWGLVIWRSVLTSWSAGSCRSRSYSSGAQWYSSWRSVSWSVYWYSALVSCPPIRIVGSICG